MEVGAGFAGEAFYDVMGICKEPVVIDKKGVGQFTAAGRSMSVWARRKAFEDIIVNE